MSSMIDSVFISEVDLQLLFLSFGHLGVVCSNPSMWAKKRWNAEVKEILSMSIFNVNFLL